MEFFASYAGADFLLFYIIMLATCVFVGIWIPANMRPEGRRGEIGEAEELAVLSGGRERHAMAVTADLLARGGVAPVSKNKFRVKRTEIETGSAGRALLRKVGEFDLREITLATAGDGMVIQSELTRRGMLMDAGERMRLRWLSVTPYIVLFAIGLYRQRAGAELGEPTGYLIGLLAVTVLFALVRLIKMNPRTKGGNEALRAAEADAQRMRTAPTANEAGFAVAVFGTGVLVGTPWEPVHAMRQAGSGDGGSGGDSDGGDGGGCGGGCGGCGG